MSVRSESKLVEKHRNIYIKIARRVSRSLKSSSYYHQPKFHHRKDTNTMPPAFTNGYAPTVQGYGLFRNVRGNPPGDLTDEEWIRAYNATDCWWRRHWNWTTEQAEEIRLCGYTRIYAIKKLVEDGRLAEDFVDSDP